MCAISQEGYYEITTSLNIPSSTLKGAWWISSAKYGAAVPTESWVPLDCFKLSSFTEASCGEFAIWRGTNKCKSNGRDSQSGSVISL